MKFALAGNPNCGKTTLFNALTGSTAHVGNWPGVTVDKREGSYKKLEEKIDVVDLPGIYSLSPYTPEEVIARNYILDENPDAIVNVVDATNLERNLYLTTQLLESDIPVVVALNMSDLVEANGDVIDAAALEKALGVPVVAVSALKGKGIHELMKRGYEAAKAGRKGYSVVAEAVKPVYEAAISAVEDEGISNPVFHAVKLVEEDELEVATHAGVNAQLKEIKASLKKDAFGGDYEALVADARYKYISANYSSALKKKKREKLSKSDKADKVLTHRIWGIPIFIVILFAIFHLTFSENLFFISGLPGYEDLGLVDKEGEFVNFGASLLGCILNDGAIFSPGCIINNIWNDIIVGNIVGGVDYLIEFIPADWAVGFLEDGVVEGLAAVLSFIPQICVLFLMFSILEDSGYMARVAFILDRIFRKFGLSGRAFMPMIMGFGCGIPAMINTRTLSDEKERTATIRVIPFFSCGAKLPILTAIAGGIAGYLGLGNVDFITFAMYLIGIVTAIVSVILMRSTTMRGEIPPFIMELPTYHSPRFKNLMIHVWDKAKHFIKKAFTIILVSTIVIWFFSHFNWSWQMLEDEQINESILASIGMLLQPIFTPLGFGAQLGEWGWVFAVAAITGLIAKENVIATFATLASCIMAAGVNLSGVDVDALEELSEGASSAAQMIVACGMGADRESVAALLSFIVFNMTTIPCFAAVATAKSELPSAKSFNWTLVFWLAASYIASCIVYTIGAFIWPVAVWIVAVVVMCVVIHNVNKKKDRKACLQQR